jgi:hypothetical protein
MISFDGAVIHTKSLNDFLAAWSFAASASGSAVGSAAGSGEEPEVDSSTGAITCFFFFRMEGTSLSTFLLLTEDMLLSCSCVVLVRKKIWPGPENKFPSAYRDLAFDWPDKIPTSKYYFRPSTFLSASPLYRKNGTSKKEEAHAPWCQ